MSEELKYEDAVEGIDSKEEALEAEHKEVSWAEKVLETAMTLEAEAELALAEAAVKKDTAELAWSVANGGVEPSDNEVDLVDVRASHASAEAALEVAKAQTEACKTKLADELEDVEAAQAAYDKYKAVIESHEAAEAAKVAAEEGRVANIHAAAVVAAMVAEGHDFDHKCEPCSCPTSSEVAEAVANKIMNTGVGAVEDMANKVVARLKAMEGDSALLRVVVKVVDFFI